MCKGAARFARQQDAEDEEYRKGLGKDPSPSEPLPSDGRHVRTKLMTPAEVEAAKQRRRGGGG